ncbi:efflux transporter outer membrane subunit [Catenovulum adriaticum]|uniref:Efflux transporter outer membrane subunit n=1 Tax=Catenovulum adriaticum TaxID=2984846 RepID=A0ABY7APB3_9ALTE|nr:efflux transporter outer membrane subunit [Catenovulum sp. TS8]WAJ70285.1 efflux transporter outer membrane subunit [Catenovulum sp. TS8]
MKKISVYCLVLWVTACAYQPNQHDLSMQMPAQLNQLGLESQVSAQTLSLSQMQWWQTFTSPQLNSLMSELDTRNLSIAAAQLRLDKSRALLAQQQADYWPSVSARASQRNGYNFDNQNESSSSSLGFSAAYEIDLWGTRDAANASAKLNLIASQQQVQSVLLQLQIQLASQYFSHLSLLQRLDISTQNLAASESLLKLIQAQFEAGSASGIEVSQQTNSLLSAQAQLMTVERDINFSQRALAALLGKSDMQIELKYESIEQLSIPEISQRQSAKQLMQRPDIQIAQTQLRLQDANLYQVEQQKWPSLTVSADLSLADLMSFGSGWSAAIASGLSMPIFNAGKIDQQIEVAKTDVQIALANYQDAVVQAVKESLNSLTELSYQTNLYQVKQQELDNNQRLYRLAQIRFDSGDTDFLNLLNAQRSWFNAKLTHAAAKRDILQANIDVYKALAGKPEFKR